MGSSSTNRMRGMGLPDGNRVSREGRATTDEGTGPVLGDRKSSHQALETVRREFDCGGGSISILPSAPKQVVPEQHTVGLGVPAPEPLHSVSSATDHVCHESFQCPRRNPWVFPFFPSRTGISHTLVPVELRIP